MGSKNMHLRTFLVLSTLTLLVLQLSGEPDKVSGEDTRAAENWTILSYISGDVNIEGYFIDDLNEMEMAASDDTNIIVQLDRHEEYDSSSGDWTDARRYEIQFDESDEIASSRVDDPQLGELDMNDPDTLQDFLEWGLSSYPADHYMIILEGHADAPVKGLLKDEDSTIGNNHMKTHEMGEAIRNAVDNTIDRPLDVVSFDVCYMGMAETAAEVMDHSIYMMGSVDFVPGAGWPYDKCLPLIYSGVGTLEERLAEIVDIFTDEYTEDFRSQSVIYLPEFRNSFLPAWKELSLEMFYTAYEYKDVYESIIAPVDKPSQLDGQGSNERYLDALQFARYLANDVRTPEMVRIAAEKVVSTQDGFNLHYKGGANHPSDAKLLGIYLPEKWDAPSYADLHLSVLTPWDDMVKLYVRDLDLKPSSPNWTTSRPSQIPFVLRTSTPGGITKAWVEVITSEGFSNVTMLGKSGYFNGTLQVPETGSIKYRYRVESIYGGTVDLPPDGTYSIAFTGDPDPPEVIHDPPVTTQIALEGGGLTFFARDSSGIQKYVNEKVPRLEYWEDPASPYSIPLTEKGMNEFTGWTEYWGLPSGITPDSEFNYRVIIEDVLGNSAQYPEEGTWTSKMGVGGRFYMDGSRSMMEDHSLFMESFLSLGMSLEINMDPGAMDDLSPYKGYVIIEPTGEYPEEDALKLLSFLENGGEVMVLMDPSDQDQMDSALWILEELDIEPVQDGSISGFLPPNPASELGSTLPQITSTMEGSYDLSEGGVAVYFTQPPEAALYTDWYGTGRLIVGHSSLLDDAMMERSSVTRLSEILVSYMYQNMAPVPIMKMEPGNLVAPGEMVTFNMSGSYDMDGEIVEYDVSISDGTMKSGPEPTLDHVFMDSGVYTVNMIVHDGEEGWKSLSTTIRVNAPPTTDHSKSTSKAHAGEQIAFNYKGHDPEGDAFIVEWDFGDGYKVTGKNVYHSYRMKGEYMYTIRIVDIWGLENIRTGIVVIENSDPLIDIDRSLIMVNGAPANFSGDLMVTVFMKEGDTLEIDAGETGDPDLGDVPIFSWDMGDGAVYNQAAVTHKYTKSGLLVLNLTVTDDHGGYDHFQLSLLVENNDPFAAFQWEEDSGRLKLNASLSTDDPWDLDGLTYKWDFGDGSTKTTEVPEVEHQYRFGGSYRVELEVVDGDGASSRFQQDVEVSGMGLWTFILVVLSFIIVTAGLVIYLRYRQVSRNNRIEAGRSDMRDDEIRGPNRIRSFSRPDPVRRDMKKEGNEDGDRRSFRHSR